MCSRRSSWPADEPESLSAFVVSMAQAPSDVLAVEAFQVRRRTACAPVPLFERIDVGRAADALRALLAIPDARPHQRTAES